MKHILIFTVILLMLSACGGGKAPEHHGLTPFPAKNDLKDEKLVEAISLFLTQKGAPLYSEYDFVRVDLNNDGNREGIVLFKLPHTYWCGWDGCGMTIFQANAKSFSPLSNISSVRGPIYVANQTTNGWRDIVLRVSGTTMRDKNIILQFSGNNYPQSPLLAPTMNIPLSSIGTEKFFR